MPFTLPLSKMTRQEKLLAMESLWADLSADDSQVESPAWHAEVLNETAASLGSGKEKISDWAEAKVRLRRKASKAS